MTAARKLTALTKVAKKVEDLERAVVAARTERDRILVELRALPADERPTLDELARVVGTSRQQIQKITTRPR